MELFLLYFILFFLFIFRVIMCNRQESRPGEAVARVLLKPISYLFPTAITMPVETLSRAMINNVISPGEPFEVYENKAIHQLSGRFSGCKNENSRVAQASEEEKAM